MEAKVRRCTKSIVGCYLWTIDTPPLEHDDPWANLELSKQQQLQPHPNPFSCILLLLIINTMLGRAITEYYYLLLHIMNHEAH